MAFIPCTTRENAALVEEWKRRIFLQKGVEPAGTEEYRQGVYALAAIVAAEIKTCLVRHDSAYSNGEGILLVPIMVAGEALLEMFRQAFPRARFGHVWTEHVAPNGVAEPIMYKTDFPVRRKEDRIIFLDQVAATGLTLRGSIEASVSVEEDRSRVIIATLFSARVAVERLAGRYPYYALDGNCEIAPDHMLDPGPGNTGKRWRGMVPASSVSRVDRRAAGERV